MIMKEKHERKKKISELKSEVSDLNTAFEHLEN